MNASELDKQAALRQLPGVDRLLATNEAAALAADYGHTLLVAALRAVLAERRPATAAWSMTSRPGRGDRVPCMPHSSCAA